MRCRRKILVEKIIFHHWRAVRYATFARFRTDGTVFRLLIFSTDMWPRWGRAFVHASGSVGFLQAKVNPQNPKSLIARNEATSTQDIQRNLMPCIYVVRLTSNEFILVH